MTRPHLAPCVSCARHVRVTEDACPFCGAALAASLRESAPPRGPAVRLGRAALLAFSALGTTGTLSATPGCSSSSTSTIAPYGIPPVPDGGDSTDAADAAGVVFAPPYGIFPQPEQDAGEDGAGGGAAHDPLDSGVDTGRD